MRLQENGLPYPPKEHPPVFMTTSTSTTGYKETRKEIEAEIVHFARKFCTLPWYKRGDAKRSLKYWVNKLKHSQEG